MNTSKWILRDPSADTLCWVEVTGPRGQKFWARTSRMLVNSSPQQKEEDLIILKAGYKVIYETSGLTLQCVPMPIQDRKRLVHLLTFEQASFRLGSFHRKLAMFHLGDEDYMSMNEMAERGHLPKPAIAINRLNVPIINAQGQLIDAFVPIELITANFYSPKSYLADHSLSTH